MGEKEAMKQEKEEGREREGVMKIGRERKGNKVTEIERRPRERRKKGRGNNEGRSEWERRSHGTRKGGRGRERIRGINKINERGK